MRINIKFKDGVAGGLCGSCQHSHVMIDRRDHEAVVCEWLHPHWRIVRPLRHCNNYQAKGAQDKHEMEKVAWILEIKKGAVIGFRPPSEKKTE